MNIATNPLTREPKMRRSRAGLLTAMLVVGVAASASAQADSLLAVSSGGANLLRLNTDGSFILRGALGVGQAPASGAGIRMFWFPANAAFRAGQVAGSQWDAANIGVGSVAFGTNTMATGASSFAAGSSAGALGDEAIALGFETTASGLRSLAFNGTASGASSAAIGNSALAAGLNSIAIGALAQASNESSIALGPNSTSLGTAAIAIGPSMADGDFGVAIGQQNGASGEFSLALGRNARTNGQGGAVVISDGSGPAREDSVYATAPNQFVVRGSGGIIMYTSSDLTSGVSVDAGGGSWNSISDRNRKENFTELDGEEVLTRLRSVPVTGWNYLTQDETVRHVGPMAQDFHAAFGLGESDLVINTGDIDGINLAGVKALEARTIEQADRIRTLESQLEALTARLERLEQLEAAASQK